MQVQILINLNLKIQLKYIEIKNLKKLFKIKNIVMNIEQL